MQAMHWTNISSGDNLVVCKTPNHMNLLNNIYIYIFIYMGSPPMVCPPSGEAWETIEIHCLASGIRWESLERNAKWTQRSKVILRPTKWTHQQHVCLRKHEKTNAKSLKTIIVHVPNQINRNRNTITKSKRHHPTPQGGRGGNASFGAPTTTGGAGGHSIGGGPTGNAHIYI